MFIVVLLIRHTVDAVGLLAESPMVLSVATLCLPVAPPPFRYPSTESNFTMTRPIVLRRHWSLRVNWIVPSVSSRNKARTGEARQCSLVITHSTHVQVAPDCMEPAAILRLHSRELNS